MERVSRVKILRTKRETIFTFFRSRLFFLFFFIGLEELYDDDREYFCADAIAVPRDSALCFYPKSDK